MNVSRSGSKLVSKAALLVSALSAVACGGIVTFSGQNAFSIAGTQAPPPPEAPPAPPSRVEVRSDKIEIKEKIQFEYNKAVILPSSFSLLDEIADTIKKNPQLKKLSVEGHASSEGNAAHNLKLSDERAASVRKYLVDKGVDAARLTSKGFGANNPIASNDTDEGKEKNRRVEFIIVEQDVTEKKVEVDHTGQEKVVEETKTTEKAQTPAEAKKLPAPPKSPLKSAASE